MISILDKLDFNRRIDELESKLESESKKNQRLEKTITEFYTIINSHQKTFEEIRHTMAEFARGMKILSDTLSNITYNNNAMIPHMGQLQLENHQLAAGLSKLIEMLIEEEVIPKVILDFKSLH